MTVGFSGLIRTDTSLDPPGKNILSCESVVEFGAIGWLLTWDDEFLVNGGSSCQADNGDYGQPDCDRDDSRRGCSSLPSFPSTVGVKWERRLYEALRDYEGIAPRC